MQIPGPHVLSSRFLRLEWESVLQTSALGDADADLRAALAAQPSPGLPPLQPSGMVRPASPAHVVTYNDGLNSSLSSNLLAFDYTTGL